jgi:hypothetical protein
MKITIATDEAEIRKLIERWAKEQCALKYLYGIWAYLSLEMLCLMYSARYIQENRRVSENLGRKCLVSRFRRIHYLKKWMSPKMRKQCLSLP